MLAGYGGVFGGAESAGSKEAVPWTLALLYETGQYMTWIVATVSKWSLYSCVTQEALYSSYSIWLNNGVLWVKAYVRFKLNVRCILCRSPCLLERTYLGL